MNRNDELSRECKKHDNCVDCKFLEICSIFNPVIKVGNTLQVAEDIQKTMKRSWENGILDSKRRNGNS